jgi:hypothetical protein
MVVMKRIYFIHLSLLLTLSIFAQSGKEVNLNGENNEIHSRFNNRKEKGFYNIMHVSLLLGSSQFTDRQNNSYTRSPLNISPSFTITNGYLFNEHWTGGAGVGFEIFDYNLFPLFAELRYTLWDHKISPFVVLKGGYSIANLKAKHYDELYLNWPPYNINDTRLRNYGGFMVHPEVGVKVPLNENSDLLFTVAYRYQKTKSVARKEYTNGQFDEWEHKEDISRLSFGIAIMFR